MISYDFLFCGLPHMQKGPTYSPDSVKLYGIKLLLPQDSNVPTMPLNISRLNTDTSMAAQMGTCILAACTTRAQVRITTVVCWCIALHTLAGEA